MKDHKHNKSDLSSDQAKADWKAPQNITELDVIFEGLRTIGDRDEDNVLMIWREHQLRVMAAVTPGELEKKFDILEDWVGPGNKGLTEDDCLQVYGWVRSIRKDALAILKGEKI
ncbi:MAG: hypothetical protein GYB52_20770 [Rhodospirillales bacterium]|nr:hypothetical protein [Rhodospirillales bacterium]MBR9819063.1 hypothetical protein [Rhodospirillales bacterium]